MIYVDYEESISHPKAHKNRGNEFESSDPVKEENDQNQPPKKPHKKKHKGGKFFFCCCWFLLYLMVFTVTYFVLSDNDIWEFWKIILRKILNWCYTLHD